MITTTVNNNGNIIFCYGTRFGKVIICLNLFISQKISARHDYPFADVIFFGIDYSRSLLSDNNMKLIIVDHC